MRALLPTASLLLALLAGCSSLETATTTSADVQGQPMLQGVVIDVGIRPLANATVRVQDTNQTAVTDADGRYSFAELPVDRFLVLVATKEGYGPDARQITIPAATPMRLNFTLELVPVLQPRSQVLPFNGLIGCQMTSEVSGGNRTFDCGAGSTEATRWDFAVDTHLAGAVIEVGWNATQPGANTLGARLETLDLGQANAVLAEVIGPSHLRLVVPQATATKYYAAGGLMRLTVYAQPDNDANEAGAGAAFAFQQDFRAFASLFYVEPPDPTYSVFDA